MFGEVGIAWDVIREARYEQVHSFKYFGYIIN